MAEKQISLEIVNPEKIVYTADVYSIVAPGANGLWVFYPATHLSLPGLTSVCLRRRMTKGRVSALLSAAVLWK